MRPHGVRACLLVLAGLAGRPSMAAPAERLPVSRSGAAASACIEEQSCTVDATRTVGGIGLILHHTDTESTRLTSLRIGPVDIGVGASGLDEPIDIALIEGTLADGSAAIAVRNGELVTVCGIA